MKKEQFMLNIITDPSILKLLKYLVQRRFQKVVSIEAIVIRMRLDEGTKSTELCCAIFELRDYPFINKNIE